MTENQKLFALLIDGDNISATIIRQIWDKLKTYGEMRISEVFHNKANIEQWEQITRECAIAPIWVPNNTPHKNSVDIALVMEAMSIFYERPDITSFCIISNDSDYTRLVNYLKSKGKFVLGIGQEQTPKPFRTACTEFMDINELLNPVLPTDRADLIQKTAITPKEIPDHEVLKLLIEAYDQIAKTGTPNSDQSFQLLDLKEKMTELNPEFQLNNRLLAERLKSFEADFPKWFKIHEQLDKKPVLHSVYLPEDSGIYKFLAAYIYAAKIRKVADKEKWVQLLAISQGVQELFPDSYRVKYKGVAKPQKVIEKMCKDNQGFIELNTDEEHPKLRFVAASSKA